MSVESVLRIAVAEAAAPGTLRRSSWRVTVRIIWRFLFTLSGGEVDRLFESFVRLYGVDPQ